MCVGGGGFLGKGKRRVLTMTALQCQDGSSAEEAEEGHRFRASPSLPCLSLSCGKRNVMGQRLGQAGGQVQGQAFLSFNRLFLVPGIKERNLKLPPRCCRPGTLCYFYFGKAGISSSVGVGGDRGEGGESEGSRNYFTSIKKKVRSLILSSQQVDM